MRSVAEALTSANKFLSHPSEKLSSCTRHWTSHKTQRGRGRERERGREGERERGREGEREKEGGRERERARERESAINGKHTLE